MALEAGEVELCSSDDHGSFLLQRLNQLRQEGLLCDFSLQIGKRTFVVTTVNSHFTVTSVIQPHCN